MLQFYFSLDMEVLLLHWCVFFSLEVTVLFFRWCCSFVTALTSTKISPLMWQFYFSRNVAVAFPPWSCCFISPLICHLFLNWCASFISLLIWQFYFSIDVPFLFLPWCGSWISVKMWQTRDGRLGYSARVWWFCSVPTAVAQHKCGGPAWWCIIIGSGPKTARDNFMD